MTTNFAGDFHSEQTRTDTGISDQHISYPQPQPTATLSPKKNGRRMGTACDYCRHRHVACDKGIPCGQCNRRGRVCSNGVDKSTGECTYDYPVGYEVRTSAEMPQSTEEDPKITSFEASWNRLEAAYLALINCPNSTGMNRRNFYAASQKQQTQETSTNSLENLQSLQKHQMLHQQQHQQPRQLLPQRPQQHRHQQRHHHNSFSSQNSAQNTARQFGFTEMYEDNQLPAINKSNTSNNCSSINTATSNATVPNVGLIVDSDNNQTTAKVTPAQDANIPLRAPMTLADLLESPADGINDYIMLA